MASRQSALQRVRSHARLVALAVVARVKQVVAYGRVSTDIQREAETIRLQVHKIEGTIAVHASSEIDEKDRLHLVGSFYDDGVSGTIPLQERPEGRRLVALICSRADIDCDGSCNRTNVVDQVWITKLDRLARKLLVLLEIEAFLTCHDVGLHCIEHGIDTSTATGRMVFTVLGVIAQWEAETIKERVTSGRHKRAEEGGWLGSDHYTLGLKVDEDGHLVVDDTIIEAAGEMAYRVVQQMFENIALHGSSAHRESQRLGMSARRVQLMLHNPRYKGEGGILTNDGEWIAAKANKPPQLVTPEIWDMVQDRLLENRRGSRRNRKYDYLLTGMMICCEPCTEDFPLDRNGVEMGRGNKEPGLCGRIFGARRDKKYGKQYVYYYCSRHGCTSKGLRGEDVEAAVWAEVDESLRNPGKYLANINEAQRDEVTGRLRAELTTIVTSLTKLESEREMVLRYGEKKLRPEYEVEARVKEIIAEMAPLHAQRAALELQVRAQSMAQADERIGLLNVTNLLETLDEIKRTNDRAAMTQLIKGAVRRIEVRTVNGQSQINLMLRVGGWLSIDPRSDQTETVNQQTNMGDEVIVVREILLPARSSGPRPGTTSRPDVAARNVTRAKELIRERYNLKGSEE